MGRIVIGDKPVQIFVVDTAGSFETTARLAIECSLKIFLKTYQKDYENWTKWLDGSFTKNVRRAKPAVFDKVIKDFDTSDFFMKQNDSSRCLSFAPMKYSAMTKTLSKLQVSGTFLLHEEDPVSLQDVVFVPKQMIIAMDGSLGLSDGKMIAQICHVAWAMLLKMTGSKENLFKLSDNILTYFIDQICCSRIVIFNQIDFRQFSQSFHDVVIKDNGLTELEKPTITGVGKIF